METTQTQDIVPQIASALAANLTQEERDELDEAITPRVAELFAQAFGDQYRIVSEFFGDSSV